MKRLIVLFLLALTIAPAFPARADSISATATLSVVILPSPLTARMQPGCEFVVEQSSNEAHCTATLVVVDSTLRNTGWKIIIAATGYHCGCDAELKTGKLIVTSSEQVVVLNGQPVDPQGGPKIESRSIGNSVTSSSPVFVARPDFGNGAYSLTMDIRMNVPTNSSPGTYVPIWAIKLAGVAP